MAERIRPVVRFGRVTVMAAVLVIFGTSEALAQLTFAKDVAPIFQEKCQVCHHPGTSAPMSLVTYQDVRPWVRAIRQRVSRREMPPWHLDKSIGITEFKNDRSLSDQQIETIVSWIDGGAQPGDPKDMPPPVQFADEDQWFIGKPDLIVSLPKEHVQYASGSDWWIDYVAETGLTEDRYIKAIQTRPSKDGFRIVHHAVATLINDPVKDPEQGTFLSEYAVGKPGEVFPDGTARLMKAGSRVKFNMHYFAVGEEVRDQTSIGFVFYPKGYKPKQHIDNLLMNEYATIDIPPGEMASSEAFFRLPQPARITSFQPHMHIRGKAMCFDAILPNGRRETLNCADRFNFNWHIMYVYQDHVAPLLPANTMLRIIAIHDNTVANPTNPDPTLWVGRGGRSIDEMSAAHIGIVYLTEDEYKQQVAERQEQLATATGNQQQQ